MLTVILNHRAHRTKIVHVAMSDEENEKDRRRIRTQRQMKKKRRTNTARRALRLRNVITETQKIKTLILGSVLLP